MMMTLVLRNLNDLERAGLRMSPAESIKHLVRRNFIVRPFFPVDSEDETMKKRNLILCRRNSLRTLFILMSMLTAGSHNVSQVTPSHHHQMAQIIFHLTH